MPIAHGTVLVADDEASVRWVLKKALESEGHTVLEAEDGAAALDRLAEGGIDAAFVDLRMPRVDGLAVLDRSREHCASTPIIVITAQATMANAIEAMKRGAFEYVTKPFDVGEIQALAQRAIESARMATDLRRLKEEMKERFEPGVTVIGKSPAMQEIYKNVGRVAKTDATVLISGDSGTGKELIAKVIHYHSNRWSGPFIALNCSAIPRDLLESELFGHERGAFTGAVEQHLGKFELAKGGTLFLDEIGDMPLDLQVKLLRVLQDRTVTRLGGQTETALDCRIIAATNRDLERAVETGRFRADLFFRLNVVPIRVPSLRQRRSDIPELVEFFLDKTNREMGTVVRSVSPEARELLVRHEWPGNVRELENTVTRAIIFARGSTLMPHDLAFGSPGEPQADWTDLSLEDVLRRKLRECMGRLGGGGSRGLYGAVLACVERPLIEVALERTGGNQLKAAALLGINRNTLRKKMNELRIASTRDAVKQRS